MTDEYTPEELAFYREVLERFPGEKRVKSETDADALCPVHGDRNPSLGIDLRRNGRGPEVKVNCRSRGCDKDEILEAVGLAWPNLYFDRNGSAFGTRIRPKRNVEVSGCTLEEYAAYKNLPVDFLTSAPVSLEDSTWGDKPAVSIPYMDFDGILLFWRFRTGLRKTEPDTRMRSEKGAKQTLYGLNWVDVAFEKDYVLLVEGESDCHVLWYHGLPAIGIPGAKNWRGEWADHLDGIGTILVAVEPDKAGEEMFSKLVACTKLYPRLEKVRFSDAF